MGQPGQGGGATGDLILEVNIAKHGQFERKGKDIYSKAKIDMVHAALGTHVEVQTLHGTVTVKVPAGIQPGQKLRLQGHGVAGPDGSKGDHYVEVVVSIPKDLNDKQKELLRELGGTYADSVK